MTTQPNNDDLGDLLRESYSAPPPRDGFVDSLRTSMCRALHSQRDSRGEAGRRGGAGLCLRALAHRLRLRWRLAAAITVGAAVMMVSLPSLFNSEDTASSTQRGWAPAVERMRGATPSGGVPVAPTPDESDPKIRKGMEKVGIRPYEDSQTAQGKIVFDQTIPLQFQVGAAERQDVAGVPWIIFRNYKGRLMAVLCVRTASHPKGKWRVTVQLSAEDGRELRSVAAVFENSGAIEDAPQEEEIPITFDFGPDDELTGASGFGVKIELAAEDAVITHGSGG
jgi:hypothetical protein